MSASHFDVWIIIRFLELNSRPIIPERHEKQKHKPYLQDSANLAVIESV